MDRGAELPEAPALSVVTTLYGSRPFLEDFLEELLKAIRASGFPSYEIVMVNDGSPDDSLAYALQRKKDLPQIVAIDLSRNFGHHAAVLAGLSVSRGDLVFLIDCDLEVSPDVLGAFSSRLRESSCDVVYGYQDGRKGEGLERLGGGFFWKVFNLLSDTPLPENMVTERLMSRKFVDAILAMGDRNLFLAGMMVWAGFQQVGMPVEKRQRRGESTYTLRKRINLMVNAISSFSALPLVGLFWAGLGITGLGIVAGGYLVFRKLLFNDIVPGFTALSILIIAVLGIMTSALGLIGIYLGKVFTQVQGRPPFIIRGIHR